MKQILYYLGGMLLVVGAVLPLIWPEVAPYVFSLGALIYAPCRITDRYEGRSLTIRRLRRQQILAALLMVVTAVLMFMSAWQIRPCCGGEWKIVLIIAVFIEIYTVFRIDHEMKKEHRK